MRSPLIEFLENRILLSAARIRPLDASVDPRFFVPVQSIAVKGNVAIAAPANSVAPFRLNLASLKTELARAPREFTSGAKNPLLLRLPTPDGTLQRFNIVDSPIMESGLAAEFPQIRTFRGQGVDDPSASVRLDYTPLGFHAQVISSAGRYYIDPYYLNDSAGTYVSYYRRDLPVSAATRANDLEMGEDALDTPLARAGLQSSDVQANSLTTGSQLRTFKLAVAADGEYTAAVGQGTVAGAMAAITTAMNRVDGVYESELAVRLTLVNNNSSIIYTNASTDPYTNNDPNALLTQNQTTIDNMIGNGNYDIGHVFTTGGGGLATLRCVGKSATKAKAETGLGNPTGDAFYIDYVAHEMGHQFGANHTFNTSKDSNRNTATAYEPGSGSTIMAYAGLEGSDDLQPHSDPYFHSVSLDEISAYLGTIPLVGTSTNTGNSPPAVGAGSNYTIPTGTPFALTATGSDANGDTLTYEWEERDLGPAVLLGTADNGASPLFRDYPPTTSPTRVLPKLASVLSGANQTLNTANPGQPVEKLFAVARTSTWRVIARDSRAGGGGVSTSDMTLTVVNTGSPFSVTSGNSTGITWAGNTAQTFTWDVAGTTANGINTANVKISLSIDGGNNFTTVLAASTANDGSESLVLPNTATTKARIKIEAIGNVFFDISDKDVTIQPTSSTPTSVAIATGMDTGTSPSDGVTKLNNSSGNVLKFTVSGTISGANVFLFSNGTQIGSAVATGITTTITPTSSILDNTYNITASQTENTKLQSVATGALVLTVDTLAPTMSSPSAFSYESLPHQIVYKFSENVQPSLAPSDVSLANNTSPLATLPASSFVYTAGTNTAALQFGGQLPDGDYTATTQAANVTDVAGNALAATDTLNFTFLGGDGTLDHVVNIADFNLLATNFGKPGMTFTTGNYDYSADGTVTITDFNVLATQFGHHTGAQAISISRTGSIGTSSGPVSTITPTQTDSNLLNDAGLL